MGSATPIHSGDNEHKGIAAGGRPGPAPKTKDRRSGRVGASGGTNPCTCPTFATKNVFDVLQDHSESIGGSPRPQLDAADGQPEPIVHDLHQSLIELLERPEILSLHAVRRATSVAYFSRSNGRAEVAGRQLFEKLRKIHITNPHRNRFEEMWPALKAHHDTPTPDGLSPHQILLGRDSLGQGLPLSGDGMAMDAKEIFVRQEATARGIRQQLEHAERQKSAPSSTAQKFSVGDPVWVIRPRPMGTHRTKTWFTPGEVVRRIGEDTHRIKVGHRQFLERHESQLCVRQPDLRGQHVSLDYAAHEADSDDDYAEQDDYIVEKILAQRPNASAPGGLEFKVHWQGYGPSHDTWEPVSSFAPRINTPFMDYIRKHKTKLHVSDYGALSRAIAARGA